MSKPNKMLVVNRGEIASRALFAGKSLGVESVLFCTPSDKETRAFKEASDVYLTTSSEAADSYNSLDEISQAIKSTGATCLYPGYGFLSEKKELAELCEKMNIIFIGPPSAALASLAHKGGARALAKACGLKTLELTPPFTEDQYPLLMKVAHGGGGRGHALVQKASDLKKELDSLSHRSSRLFNSTEIIYERFMPNSKHVELQIFVDKEKTHFLSTRDCTFQRNFQKLIEEGPADPEVWKTLSNHFSQINDYLMGLNYKGPGTLEFLYSSDTKELFFLEINCRIQVEHTVTEELCGVDLVTAQVANALNLKYEFKPHLPHGYAIELRIYAENPKEGFMPSTGLIHFIRLPQLPFCRMDMSYEEGHSISPFYDPLIGKLIVRDQNRELCIERTKKALAELTIFGVHTNQQYLMEILSHPDFVHNKHTVQWLPAVKQEANENEKELLQKLSLMKSASTKVLGTKKDQSWKNSHRN